MRNRRRIKSIHQSIDYDRLAQAIIQAHEQIEKKKEEVESKLEKEILEEETLFCKKYRFPPFRFVIRIGKAIRARKSDGRFTSGFMSIFLYTFFYFLTLLFASITIAFIIYNINYCRNNSWQRTLVISNLGNVLLFIMFACMSLSLTIVSLCAAREVKVEKDRNYLSSVFSGMVSLVALVISIIALCYGLS